MKSLLTTPLIAAFAFLIAPCASALDENQKVATVNMHKLFAKYHKSQSISEELNEIVQQVNIDKEKQAAELKTFAEQAELLRKEADSANLQREKKDQAIQKFQIARQEFQGRLNQHQAWIKRKQTAHNELTKMKFDAVRLELLKLVQEEAKKLEYDFIFDSSGGSDSQIAILLYSKDATDITELMLKAANKDAPAEEPAKEGE